MRENCELSFAVKHHTLQTAGIINKPRIYRRQRSKMHAIEAYFASVICCFVAVCVVTGPEASAGGNGWSWSFDSFH